jgi:hypothetical protein
MNADQNFSSFLIRVSSAAKTLLRKLRNRTFGVDEVF